MAPCLISRLIFCSQPLHFASHWSFKYSFAELPPITNLLITIAYRCRFKSLLFPCCSELILPIHNNANSLPELLLVWLSSWNLLSHPPLLLEKRHSSFSNASVTITVNHYKLIKNRLFQFNFGYFFPPYTQIYFGHSCCHWSLQKDGEWICFLQAWLLAPWLPTCCTQRKAFRSLNGSDCTVFNCRVCYVKIILRKSYKLN